MSSSSQSSSLVDTRSLGKPEVFKGDDGQDQSIRDHIIRNSARLQTFQQVRYELLEIARTNRVLQQMPAPMDIGALPKGKGKGGEKGGKGDHKGSKGVSLLPKMVRVKTHPKPTPMLRRNVFIARKRVM